MADTDALMRLSDRVGNLTGTVEGLHRLIETAVIAKIDQHLDNDREIHGDIEDRVRKLERKINLHEGHRASSAKWAAAVSGAVTLLFNGALAWFGHPAH